MLRARTTICGYHCSVEGRELAAEHLTPIDLRALVSDLNARRKAIRLPLSSEGKQSARQLSSQAFYSERGSGALYGRRCGFFTAHVDGGLSAGGRGEEGGRKGRREGGKAGREGTMKGSEDTGREERWVEKSRARMSVFVCQLVAPRSTSVFRK